MTKNKENKQFNVAEPFNKAKPFDKSESIEESTASNHAKQSCELKCLCEESLVQTGSRCELNDHLLQELRTHQVELMTQNHALREAQQSLEVARDRYADLYDCAPVGYFTLDKSGRIVEINLTGCAMLEKERVHLVGQLFITYVAASDTHIFFQHLRDTFNDSGSIVSRLRIKVQGNQVNLIRLESLVTKGEGVGRTIMTNVSRPKDAEIHNLEWLRENRMLTQGMFRLQEEERRQLARELHDELGQWLTAISAESQAISNSVSKDSGIYSGIQAIKESAVKMNEVIHGMLYQLRPVLLDSLGLADSLNELKRQWCLHHPEISFELVFKGEFENFGELINITVYRLVQEALNNISKHACASRVVVQLICERDRAAPGNAPLPSFEDTLFPMVSANLPANDILWLKIEDNGKGYDSDKKFDGLGVLGMRERTIAVNGEFALYSKPGHGTKMEIKLPIRQSADIVQHDSRHDF